MKNKSGTTLIELLIVMVIFSVVMMGLYSSYRVLSRQGGKEFRQAETSVEINMAFNMLERDLMMAGYGMPEVYDNVPKFLLAPFPYKAVEADAAGTGGSDRLILRGTALGLESRAAQGWTFMISSAPTFTQWNDMREDEVANDVGILIDPSAKIFVPRDNGGGNVDWLFRYQAPNQNILGRPSNNPYDMPSIGLTMYGIYNVNDPNNADPYQPGYSIKYYLGGTPPANCPGTLNLMRAESRALMTLANPVIPTNSATLNTEPILNCVLDFQVALGLDTNDDGKLDTWDNDGFLANTYTGPTGPAVLNSSLKQIRVYVLVQEGGLQEPGYLYSNPDPAYAGTPNIIRVGDLNLLGGAVGRNFALSAAQRRYKWKMVSIAVTPRNIH